MRPPEKTPASALLNMDDAHLVSLLQRLGRDRQADTDSGGDLWAEFLDLCWAEDEAPDDDMLSVWLEFRGGLDLPPAEVTRLRALVRART
jgi:hypothetical protein